MKNKKDIKKIWLSIGSVALATLPITSVISCSNNDSKPQNPDNGNGGNNSGSEDNKPDTKEIINYSETFHYGDAPNLWIGSVTSALYPNDPDEANLIRNFMYKYKTKILNNEIKFFDENNDPIHYEINITINKGLYVSKNGYDITKPYNPIADYADRNFYKKTNADAHFKLEFWKKENNQSYTWQDFEMINLGDKNWFNRDKFEPSESGTRILEFPKDSSIGYIEVNDRGNVVNGKMMALWIDEEVISLTDSFMDFYKNYDYLNDGTFKPSDSETNNLFLAYSENEVSSDWGYDDAINLDGTITIKQKV